MINNIIFDFDSVILCAEGVELILQQALLRLDEKTRLQCTSKLNQITYLADIGETPMAEAMQERFALAPVYREDVEAGAPRILAALSPKVRETFAALRTAGKRLFVFSTGSDEWVRPVTRALQVEDDHVFTNQLLYDDQGRVTGFDEKNPLFLSVGKGYIVEQLKNEGRLPGGTAVVGNGASDLAIRTNGCAQMFVYFSTQRTHEEIRRQADFSVDVLDQMLPLFFSEDELSHEHMQAIYAQNEFGKSAGQPQVLLLESVHEMAAKKLQHEGWNVRQGKGAWCSDKLISDAGEVQVLGIRSQTRLSGKTIAALPQLWAIGAFCIGTNQIDLQAAADAGIPVFNAPYSNTRSVAELVVGEIIMLLRRIPEKNRAAHAGQWLKSAAGCAEIRGKTVGIIGYGHIGSQVSVLLENLGMSVLFHDIVDKLPLGNARRAGGLEELLNSADVVTLHVPDTPETRNLMDASRIQKMRKGAVLINSSRGKVVDLAALRAALDEGALSGAALDVFPEEPAQPQDVFVTPLQGAANVILTPHIGGSTQEAQVNIANYVSDKLLRFVRTGATAGAVNFPEVDLPRVPHTHRILHVHRNVPGVLAKINSVFARRNINVAGQMLQTKEHIGYLIVDVDQQVSNQVLDLMQHITETIKVRKIA